MNPNRFFATYVAAIFGPDEDERRWLEFNERLEHDLGWTIREAGIPWTLFIRDPAAHPLRSTASTPTAQARQQLIDALTQARDVAWRVDSHFERVLGVARRFVRRRGRMD